MRLAFPCPWVTVSINGLRRMRAESWCTARRHESPVPNRANPAGTENHITPKSKVRMSFRAYPRTRSQINLLDLVRCRLPDNRRLVVISVQSRRRTSVLHPDIKCQKQLSLAGTNKCWQGYAFERNSARQERKIAAVLYKGISWVPSDGESAPRNATDAHHVPAVNRHEKTHPIVHDTWFSNGVSNCIIANRTIRWASHHRHADELHALALILLFSLPSALHW